MKFRDRVLRFMYGRYGPDTLNFGLLILYFVLFTVNLFVEDLTARTVISVFMWVCLLLPLLRMMSRNHVARARENRVFLKIINPVRGFFTTNFVRIRDIRQKRYRTCKRCKAVLRLPIKKGTHTVTCPKCANKFKVKIRF